MHRPVQITLMIADTLIYIARGVLHPTYCDRDDDCTEYRLHRVIRVYHRMWVRYKYTGTMVSRGGIRSTEYYSTEVSIACALLYNVKCMCSLSRTRSSRRSMQNKTSIQLKAPSEVRYAVMAYRQSHPLMQCTYGERINVNGGGCNSSC